MRTMVALAALVPILASPVGSSADNPSRPRLVCEVVAEWATSTGRNYPRSLEAVAKLPVRYRSALLRSESLTEQAELWKSQMRAFLVNAAVATPFELRLQRSVPGGITPQVRAVLLSALSSDIDYMYEAGESAAELEKRRVEFDERLSHYLDLRVRRSIFGQLGSWESGQIEVSFANRWQLEFVEEAPLNLGCTCRQALLFCGGGTSQVCSQSYPVCEPETAGCGGVGGACDGRCSLIE